MPKAIAKTPEIPRKEMMSDIDAFRFAETVWQVVRFAARMLLKHAFFTAIAPRAIRTSCGRIVCMEVDEEHEVLQKAELSGGADPEKRCREARESSRSTNQMQF